MFRRRERDLREAMVKLVQRGSAEVRSSLHGRTCRARRSRHRLPAHWTTPACCGHAASVATSLTAAAGPHAERGALGCTLPNWLDVG